MLLLSTVLRFLKLIVISFVALIGLIVSFTAYGYYFPPTYEARVMLGKSNVEVVAQIEPMHPFLAEYRRSLVLRRAGGRDVRVEMFPDSGGYLRSQVYELPDGKYIVRGSFDAFEVDPVARTIRDVTDSASQPGRYLGAFDDTKQHKWRFIEASQSPERDLVPQGG